MKLEAIYDIDCVFEGFCNKGAIYLSNLAAAHQATLLKSLNIVAIISIAQKAYLEAHHDMLGYLYIPAQDSEKYTISKHFQQTSEFLDKYRKEGNVLVHCIAGKSRSVAIVAAYLLKKYKYSLPDTMTLLKRKRPKINPNQGFMDQLEEYSKELGISAKKSDTRETVRQNRLYQQQQIRKNKKKAIAKSAQLKQEKASLTTSQSLQRSKLEQQSITDKIERLREKVMQKGKSKSRAKVGWKFLGSTESATFQSNSVTVNWKQNKSLNLE